MKINHRWHSFSLVELVVVLAVMGIILAAGLFAFGSAQRTSRDQERKLMVSKLVTIINDYFRTTSVYPAANAVVWGTTSVSVAGTPVTLKGYLSYSATETNASRTRYYYGRDSLGYVFCARLESGLWYREGTGLTACPTN